MKVLYALLMLVLVGIVPVEAQAQVGTSCMGCMPRTGQVYDSTKTMPAPSFTTSASTGDVYIPPREVIVTVPGPSTTTPAPSSNDPYSFSSTKFTCSAGGSAGIDAAAGAALALYKSQGNRCADTDGMTYWATVWMNCIAREEGWPIANAANTAYYASKDAMCKISAGMGNLAVDQGSMNGLCAADASTRGFVSPSSYQYVRSTSSTICSK